MIACKRMKEGEKDSYFYTEGSEFDLATRGEMHISVLFCIHLILHNVCMHRLVLFSLTPHILSFYISLSYMQRIKHTDDIEEVDLAISATRPVLPPRAHCVAASNGWIVAVVECSHPPNVINNMSSSSAAQQLLSSSS